MVNLRRLIKLSRGMSVFIILCFLTILSGCRWIKITPEPSKPKQGDIVQLRITVGESNDQARV